MNLVLLALLGSTCLGVAATADAQGTSATGDNGIPAIEIGQEVDDKAESVYAKLRANRWMHEVVVD